MEKRDSTSTSNPQRKSQPPRKNGHSQAARDLARSQGKIPMAERRLVSAEERERLIQEAAYFYAMNSQCADDIANWLRAEREIDGEFTLSS